MRAPDQLRVLLIDDDELSRAVLELHLSAAGYVITEAESGEAALERLQDGAESGFDLILSDLQMPGLHGPALARAMRDAAGEQVPLLAMSGSQPAAERYAGFDGFLLKPFSPEAFAEAAQRVQRGGVSKERVSQETVVLDEATFAQLEGMMKAEQLREIFALSLTEMERHRERMQRAMEESDAAALQASAHAMKGGFALLGALEMRELGARLEAGTGTPADQTATLREIPLAAERLRRMLTSRGLAI